MALLAKHRASIYTKLSPVIGDEETEALLAQFPSRDDEEPITKLYLRSELNKLEGSLRTDMAKLEGNLRAEMKDMRTELKGDIAAIRGQVDEAIAQLMRWVPGTCMVAIGITATIVSIAVAIFD